MKTAGYKINTLTAILIFIFVICGTSSLAQTASDLKTDKDIYGPGETIKVSFFNAPGSSRDWICIVAAGAPDNDAGDYKYMPNRLTEGELTFDTPPPGKYEVRAFYNYSRRGYVVSARYSFSVVDRAVAIARPVPVEEKVKTVDGPAVRDIPLASARFNICIFYFTPLSVDATNYSIKVTNALNDDPKLQSVFSILGKKDLELFLSANNLQQSDEIDNIIDIGTRLGLNFVVAGSIEKKGMLIVTNYKVVSIGQRNSIYSNQMISRGEADLTGNIRKMSSAIIEAIQRSN